MRTVLYPQSNQRLIPLDEARRILGGIGRTKMHELCRPADGPLRVVKIGRRSFLPESELSAYVAALMAERPMVLP